MKTILLSSAISMIVALIGTKPTITVLRERKLGQQVRTGENAPAHLGKNGTPTMGRWRAWLSLPAPTCCC